MMWDDDPLPRFDPVASELFADPYRVYRRYLAEDPVHWGEPALVGYPGAWYVFGHADVMTVLKDERFGKARRHSARAGASAAPSAIPEEARPYLLIGQQWLAHRDPPDHSRIHDVLWPFFTTGAVEHLRPRMEQIAVELLDSIDASEPTDLTAPYAAQLPFRVICSMVGIPHEDWQRFAQWCTPMRAVGLRTPLEVWALASAAAQEACGYLADLVAQRRRRPADDMTSALVEARAGGLFVDDDELIANLLFVIYAAAGLYTTTALITTGTYLLLSHPDQRALLADERALTSAANEILRFEPPLQLTNRLALEDVSLGGKTIEAGSSVLAILAAANRDPAAFTEPDRFDVRRPRRQHLAFSAGIHTCFGGPMAVVEGEVALGALLRRPKLTLCQESGPVWETTGSLRLLRHLMVTY